MSPEDAKKAGIKVGTYENLKERAASDDPRAFIGLQKGTYKKLIEYSKKR